MKKKPEAERPFILTARQSSVYDWNAASMQAIDKLAQAANDPRSDIARLGNILTGLYSCSSGVAS